MVVWWTQEESERRSLLESERAAMQQFVSTKIAKTIWKDLFFYSVNRKKESNDVGNLCCSI